MINLDFFSWMVLSNHSDRYLFYVYPINDSYCVACVDGALANFYMFTNVNHVYNCKHDK